MTNIEYSIKELSDKIEYIIDNLQDRSDFNKEYGSLLVQQIRNELTNSDLSIFKNYRQFSVDSPVINTILTEKIVDKVRNAEISQKRKKIKVVKKNNQLNKKIKVVKKNNQLNKKIRVIKK